LKKGIPFLSSREIKRLRAAMLPVNFCTSFTQWGVSFLLWLKSV
jgi:hypothetical protein